MRNIVYLSLGSNVGNRLRNLKQAVRLLKVEGMKVTQQSSIYETAAWGEKNQAPFLNQVIRLETRSNHRELLDALQKIEKACGRVPTFRWGPRIIDLDILFYNRLIFQSPGLQIPHPGIPQRRFVLAPLEEISPDLKHPRSGKTVSELLDICSDHSKVSVWNSTD